MFSSFKKWVYWLFHLEDREREAYFSRAVDPADLERRIRDWERRRHSFFG